MDREFNQGGYQKKMYDVDEVCSNCGAKITQLPFPPNPEKRSRLQCKKCWAENRPDFRR